MNILKTGETIEDLQYKGLKIVQNKNTFCFGMDAVLLSDFVKIKKGERILDLCCGSGIIPILLYGQKKASKIVGVEIMDYVADIAKRSVELNDIGDTISIVNRDINDIRKCIDGDFDVISVNPPYEKASYEKKSDNEYRVAAKHEIYCTLDDVCSVASKMLKFGGRFYMIHRTSRFSEIIDTMRKYKLEPKSIRMVYQKANEKANLVLVYALKGGKVGLDIEYPLFVRNENGDYTKEIDRIYHRI